MRREGGWSTLEEYARFLRLQHAARQPVEAWLETNAGAQLCPPPQTTLIALDLSELGLSPPVGGEEFAITGSDPTAREDETLGVAWVLAGSSLGNRSIASELGKSGHGDWPTRFLRDPAMIEFWKNLRSRLEREASAARIAAATRGAVAVFDHFLAHADRSASVPPVRTVEAL